MGFQKKEGPIVSRSSIIMPNIRNRGKEIVRHLNGTMITEFPFSRIIMVPFGAVHIILSVRSYGLESNLFKFPVRV